MLCMYLSTWMHAHIYSWKFNPGLANIHHNDIQDKQLYKNAKMLHSAYFELTT